jgi:hypothetical protein
MDSILPLLLRAFFTNLWFFQSLVNLPLFFLHGCIVIVLLVPVLGQGSELEAQLIDRQIVLPRVVLERACEKTLREEESRQPEGLRVAIIDPMLHEIERRGRFML